LVVAAAWLGGKRVDLVSDAPDQLESRADHGPLSRNGSTSVVQ
jgi:hypothetical protein